MQWTRTTRRYSTRRCYSPEKRQQTRRPFRAKSAMSRNVFVLLHACIPKEESALCTCPHPRPVCNFAEWWFLLRSRLGRNLVLASVAKALDPLRESSDATDSVGTPAEIQQYPNRRGTTASIKANITWCGGVADRPRKAPSDLVSPICVTSTAASTNCTKERREEKAPARTVTSLSRASECIYDDPSSLKSRFSSST